MPVLHDNLSNEELMIAYVCGNSAAFETLYTRNETAMLRFIRRILGSTSSAQADEVFQDVWMRIISSRQSYKPPESQGAAWKTWAFTIAHNACIDRLRVQKRFIYIEANDEQPQDPMEWIQAHLDMTHPSSEDESHWKAAGRQLLECLEELPEDQRAAFLMHHEEDSSIEELAQELGLPFETLKSRLRYAMKKLRNCMQHYLSEMGGAS